MPWKMVTRHGKNMTLKEVVDEILSQKESEAKERKIRLEEREEIENKHKEYYEAHMKEETERLTLFSMGGGGIMATYSFPQYLWNDLS